MYVSEEHRNILKFDIFKDHVGILNFVTTSFLPDVDYGIFNIGYSGLSDFVVNRVKLAMTFGLTPENFVFQTQAHSANYHIVTQEDAGAGFYLKQNAIQDNDNNRARYACCLHIQGTWQDRVFSYLAFPP